MSIKLKKNSMFVNVNGEMTPIANMLNGEEDYDIHMSDTSDNAVRNKVIKHYVDATVANKVFDVDYKYAQLDKTNVKSVNGKTPDANGNVNVEGGNGEMSEITFRPFEATVDIIGKLPEITVNSVANCTHKLQSGRYDERFSLDDAACEFLDNVIPGTRFHISLVFDGETMLDEDETYCLTKNKFYRYNSLIYEDCKKDSYIYWYHNKESNILHLYHKSEEGDDYFFPVGECELILKQYDDDIDHAKLQPWSKFTQTDDYLTLDDAKYEVYMQQFIDDAYMYRNEKDELIDKIDSKGTVKSVNDTLPDSNGNVHLEIAPKIELDTTLTVSGKASDSKAVGDKINELKDNVAISSSTQPTEPMNKIWLDESTEEIITVPDIDEFNEVKTKVDVDSARIDTIVSSATVDSEVQDIRVGADGTTYTSAGQAVREQVSQLSESITEISERFETVSANVAEITDEYFGTNSATIEVTSTGSGFTASNKGVNSYFWYIIPLTIGHHYTLSFDLSSPLSATGSFVNVNKNYAYPNRPDQPGTQYNIGNPTENGTHYTLDFVADVQECMLVFYERYSNTSFSATNIECIDNDALTGTHIKSEYLPKANNNTIGCVKIGGGLAISEDGVLSTLDNSSPIHYNGNSFDVFNKCLCIGDSLTQGIFNHNETGTDTQVLIQKYSYPSQLKKISGVDTTNLGQGGATSQNWYTMYENTDVTGHDICIIAIGVNDVAKGTTGGTTEYWLNQIINKVKLANKGIKIFLCTITPALFYKGYSEGVNNMIKNVANNTEDCYLLDMTEYSECKANTPYAQGHLTALGYNKYAKELKSYISKIIDDNLSDFRNVQFIGTNYGYN